MGEAPAQNWLVQVALEDREEAKQAADEQTDKHEVPTLTPAAFATVPMVCRWPIPLPPLSLSTLYYGTESSGKVQRRGIVSLA